MRLKKILLHGLGVFALAGALGAAQTDYAIGSTAAPWLNMPTSARASALGGAVTAVDGDLLGLSCNPAGLSEFRFQQLSFLQNNWVQESSQQHYAYGYHWEGIGTLAAGLAYMNYGSIDRIRIDSATNQPVKDGSFTPIGLAGKLAYARRFGMLAGGVTAKWIREDIDTLSSSTFGADLGLNAYLVDELVLGLAARNLGGKLHEADLPAELRAGAAYGLTVSPSLGLGLSADAAFPTADGSAWNAGGGLELDYTKLFFGRLGWRQQNNGPSGTNGLSAGIGARIMLLTLDYAFVMKGDLGNSHQFGLAASF
jgi:hypothetical protein